MENSIIEFEYKMCQDDENFYSIACCDANGNQIRMIDRISDEKRVVEEFCNMLNDDKISPCHFEDIYDDYFG